MAGHSKWANIKHRKASQDAKKGKIFTKVAKEITVAAKEGGGDPNMNARLRLALEKAKSVNLPKDNIERSIKRGTGEGNDTVYESITYEGYGHGGVAILIHTLTDNKNRTVSEVRSTLSKRGGNMGENGSVSWMFERKGFINVSIQETSEEEIMEVAIDNGAEDVSNYEDFVEVVCEPSDYESLKAALEEKYTVEYSEITMNAKNTVDVSEDDKSKLLRLVDYLEDLDDVQDVFTNME